jgi:hypothetical protein
MEHVDPQKENISTGTKFDFYVGQTLQELENLLSFVNVTRDGVEFKQYV